MKKVNYFLCLVWLAGLQVSFAAEIDDRFDKGIRLFNSGHYPEAAAAFQKVIDLDRANPEAWFFMGQSWLGAGRCQDGLNAYEQAIHLQEVKAKYWGRKGDSLRCLGRTDDALSAYEKAIELDKTLDFAWYGRACCFALKAEKASALKSLSRAIDLNPYYKEWAYRDATFRNLSNEKDFHTLIEP